MSDFLNACVEQAARHPERVAFRNSAGAQITYGELDEQSGRLAGWLLRENPDANPVAIYGHKDPLMLVGMFACMKAGCAYVPIDVVYPKQRIDDILGQLADPIVLLTIDDGGACDAAAVRVTPDELAGLVAGGEPVADLSHAVAGDDACYILFTSGSTGKPKGVVQRARSIDLTSRYFSSLAPEGEGYTVFNRAPFSFDLSIFDFLIALPNGHTMFALAQEEEASLARTFAALQEAAPTLWVSTPSFLQMCLTDPSFTHEGFPSIRKFLMCGETLMNATARACLAAFPQAALVNMYGPSETCGAVTDVAVTREMADAAEPLPVGKPSPYSEIQIVDPDTLAPKAAGERGEILILGDTAALGYRGLPEKTAACFFERETRAGEPARCYRTGDEGYLDEDGMLHYFGRLDLQVKVNGFRIELGDIEENLVSLPQVSSACVVVRKRGGVPTALAAHVVPAAGVTADRKLTKLLKDELKRELPAYMVPRTFAYHDELPTNFNGKIDRKALEKAEER